jgi:hypothetical protein
MFAKGLGVMEHFIDERCAHMFSLLLFLHRPNCNPGLPE